MLLGLQQRQALALPQECSGVTGSRALGVQWREGVTGCAPTCSHPWDAGRPCWREQKLRVKGSGRHALAGTAGAASQQLLLEPGLGPLWAGPG